MNPNDLRRGMYLAFHQMLTLAEECLERGLRFRRWGTPQGDTSTCSYAEASCAVLKSLFPDSRKGKV